jgi:riboflavin synthase
MFTGIIQEVGKIEKIVRRGTSVKLIIKSSVIWKESEVSHSIAVNGVCLTLIYIEKGLLFFEVIQPTFHKTNLKRL